MGKYGTKLSDKNQCKFCLFDLILYVPSTIFQLNRDGSSWVGPVLSWDKCVLLKDHNAVTPVRLEPGTSANKNDCWKVEGDFNVVFYYFILSTSLA